ncbi:MAG: hypothetical protein ACLFWL_17705 [Candidatus Brocadiia bacterium]
MIFHCHSRFRLQDRCEWRFIRKFVELYNEEKETAYRREVCLDVRNADRKEPEVLLEGSDGGQMVIERKSVVWPCDYIENHVHWHQRAKEKTGPNGYYEEILPENLSLEAREEALQGFAGALQKTLTSVPEKLRPYPEAVHIVLLQLIGDDTLVLDEDVERMFAEADVPEAIDQMWVAYPEWVDAWNYRIAWRKMP